MHPLEQFHPAVTQWFRSRFGAATEPQVKAWPAILSGSHTLIAAPTGSGKTLAAFLAAIDTLVRQGLRGHLPDETQVVYVSPLKALSNDVQRNLEAPLAGITNELLAMGQPAPEIRTLVRTGDTPQAERAAMRRRPPHIIVTTPESLYILLTSDSGRDMLRTTRTVIIDEIHAVAGTKRGAHLALSLERLQAVADANLTRIGLSATQKPLDRVARFLVGNRPGPAGDCAVIDIGYRRQRDLALEVPSSPLEAVMAAEVWEEVYNRLAALIEQHHTTLVFVNTRRMAERVTRHLSERIGAALVTSHHGSLAKEHRLDAEQRLKRGELRALVATASLELGIDIGDVNLVCQLGSPRAIATFLQRVGRSGHAVGGLPKGRLFPTSRDELVECAALLDAERRGELDTLHLPETPLDVLAQQVVAEVACREWREQDLYDRVCRADPYRTLDRTTFNAVVRMLAEGFNTARGRRSAHVHRDAVHGRLRGRRGARLTALMSGGTIPDNADYDVVLDPEGHFIGTINEDFAIESMAGDIFQLGNASYRILRVEAGRVRVEDAHGLPPTIPFWLGEAPARTDELSAAVSRLREEVAARGGEAIPWLTGDVGIEPAAGAQLTDYLLAARAVLGELPTQHTVILERFFDESGGMQLVIHAPFGSRINRAWGLALRKRFCRKFNFELQAAATEDAIVLSLSTSHSFPLDEVTRYLNSNTARQVLIQALLDAPMFTTRWRWNAAVALALPRFRGGKKVPAPLQRMMSEDLLAVTFPDQVACLENITGDRQIPDHPLVQQTLHDCLTEAMDVAGLERLLVAIECGSVRIIARDLPAPSPLAQEILTARPYAFLDDAPLEERRTQAVLNRRWTDPQSASDLGRLDPEAIARVRSEAWPEAENADELHDALILLGCLTETEVAAGDRWRTWHKQLADQGRATTLRLHGGDGQDTVLWTATEHLPHLLAVYPDAKLDPAIEVPAEFATRPWTRETAVVELLRGRLEGLGPVTAAALADSLHLPTGDIHIALAALEAEGFVLRGRFSADKVEDEWCERRLLARIHHYTVKRLRAEIEPVSGSDFMRFLFHWQRAASAQRGAGPLALAAVIEQMEGFEATAAAWENDILPLRVEDYSRDWLDNLCLTGRVQWLRLTPPRASTERGGISPVKSTPVAMLRRGATGLWRGPAAAAPTLTPRGRQLTDYLLRHGASFFDDILATTGWLKTQLEETLGELTAWGLATADSFHGLRALLHPHQRRGASRRRVAAPDMAESGRWTLIKDPAGEDGPGRAEYIAAVLLRRYGVVFRKLLERETTVMPPWRDLLAVYRRREARGEIRGGRFVAGFTGEQYALPEAVGMLRDVRRNAPDASPISVTAADPLNLTGIVTPGARIPATAGNRVLYQDGLPIAALVSGEVRFLTAVPSDKQWELHTAVMRGHPRRALRVPDAAA
jgi:ATP-dependent Lhr-like helicase